MDWTLETVTPPAAEPVTLDEAKAHLRVTTADEDALITRLIAASRRWCESFQGRAWVSRTYRLKLSTFPGGSRPIALPFPPLVAVNAISYTRSDGTVATLPASDCLTLTGEPSKVLPVNGWPSESLQAGLPVSIEYVAGNGASEDQVAALLLILGALYEHRQDEVEAAPRPVQMGAKALLWPMRRVYEGPDA